MGGLASRWLRAAALLAITVAVAGAAGRFSEAQMSPMAHVGNAISLNVGR
jgi:hypothetical protein